jgi:hypothetical protein
MSDLSPNLTPIFLTPFHFISFYFILTPSSLSSASLCRAPSSLCVEFSGDFEKETQLSASKHWANIGCSKQQLESLVLGSKPQSSSSFSYSSASSSSFSWAPFTPMIGSKLPARWGKDEVHETMRECWAYGS